MVFLIHFASYFCTLFLLFSPGSRCLHFLEHGIRERGVSGKGVIGPRDCVGRFRFRVDFIFFYYRVILIAINVVLRMPRRGFSIFIFIFLFFDYPVGTVCLPKKEATCSGLLFLLWLYCLHLHHIIINTACMLTCNSPTQSHSHSCSPHILTLTTPS